MLTYNHALFVSQAIEGILSQKVNAYIEIIIGDDCSTDDTLEILNRYQSKYPNIINLIKRDKNVGMMLNCIDVLSRCKGDYIAICEGDDYWLDENKLNKQLEKLEINKDSDIVFTNVKVFNQDSKAFLPNWVSIKKKKFDIEDLLQGNFISACTVMFRNILNKDLLNLLSRFKIADWPLYLLILNTKKSYALYINDITSVYRQHNGGAFSAIKTQERMNIVLSVYYELLKIEGFNFYNKIIYRKISSVYYFLGSTVTNVEIKNENFQKAIRLFSIQNIRYPLFSKLKVIYFSLLNKSKMI